MSYEVFTEDQLKLEVLTEAAAIRVRFSGRSVARQPGPFILNVLVRALERSAEANVPLALEFQGMGYMNSSTITPLIRLLDHARTNGQAVKVVYRKDLKWQALSFTALCMFETEDRRIEIQGV